MAHDPSFGSDSRRRLVSIVSVKWWALLGMVPYTVAYMAEIANKELLRWGWFSRPSSIICGYLTRQNWT